MIYDTKYVFFGTPEFAAIILEKLSAAGMPPAAVVCNPDRPVGRKKIITSPPTKVCVMRQESRLRQDYGGQASVKNKIEILQPENLSSLIPHISSLQPDFAVVAAYGKIISREILNLFPKGVIGVHPSLLPKHRGSSPIQAAILNSDSETGVTLFLLDEKVDHGPIVSSITCQVSGSDSYETLLQKLAASAGDLLVKTLPKFAADEVKPMPQDESQATYTKKFTTQDGFVDADLLRKAEEDGGAAAVEIERKIRALNPEPSVWSLQNSKRVKLLEAAIENRRLKLKKIQIEGEKPKSVAGY